MSRAATLAVLALVVALAGCKVVDGDSNAAAAAPAGGPPPLPPHQMRAQMAEGDRLHTAMDGKDLFSNRCGACHLEMGMGTNLITKQQMALGRPPTMGLLVNRDDLTADYVKSVARMGKGAMPRQTRVDVTDAELDKIAAYL
ncbi:MAG: cytochrome c, partial [Sphingomonadales bacterium]|nr:cytochrome c [Sphingomonadales bacterium]